MEITKELLIDQLFENQENQFVVGYNTALIQLLKKANGPYIPVLTLEEKLIAQMHKQGWVLQAESMTKEQVKAVTDFIKNGSKLAAIKLMKDYFGLQMGLKECKDVIDAVVAIHD